MTDLHYWVWLSSLTAVSPLKKVELIKHFCDPYNIWKAKEVELGYYCSNAPAAYEQLISKELKEKTNNILELATRQGIKMCCLKDSIYPSYLKEIHDPPTVLYYKGIMKQNECCIGVVGSRKASSYGLNMASKLSCTLGRFNVAVVSGMARGIDSYAHHGAIEGGGRTIAVLGCGIDIVYPRENKKLMDDIIATGLVMSEYPPGTQPVHYNFPQRNRVISGLSRGVVVIEAGAKSGSLITADFALEQGRDVYALPGNIDNRYSQGTNKLIKEGAKIVTCFEDVIEELGISNYISKRDDEHTTTKEAYSKKSSILMYGLDKDEKNVVHSLLQGCSQLDEITKKAHLSIPELNATLTMLELKGIIEQFPGKIFKLKE